MPEEQPLQHLALLLRALEAEEVVLVHRVREVEQLRGGLVDREGRALRVVDEGGDPAVGVESEVPCGPVSLNVLEFPRLDSPFLFFF